MFHPLGLAPAVLGKARTQAGRCFQYLSSRSKASYASRNSRTRAPRILSRLAIIRILSSLNCFHCLRHTRWFIDSSHDFGVVNGTRFSVFLPGTCFGEGLWSAEGEGFYRKLPSIVSCTPFTRHNRNEP